MTQEPFDLEAVYDDEIAPLMTQIIAICKAHKLPMFTTFVYRAEGQDSADLCTTNLPFDERPMPSNFLALEPTARRGHDRGPAMKLTTRDAGGKIVRQEVIIP